MDEREREEVQRKKVKKTIRAWGNAKEQKKKSQRQVQKKIEKKVLANQSSDVLNRSEHRSVGSIREGPNKEAEGSSFSSLWKKGNCFLTKRNGWQKKLATCFPTEGPHVHF